MLKDQGRAGRLSPAEWGITMRTFAERYQAACEELKKECDIQVENGELSKEEANFRYFMVRDEILMDMEE